MNFLYIYPTYKEAKDAFNQKRLDLQGSGLSCNISNLNISNISDNHKFIMTPVRVVIDTDRLKEYFGIVNAQAVVEELANEMTRELSRLMEFIQRSAENEVYYDRGRNSAKDVQTLPAPPTGTGTPPCSPELDTKIISGQAGISGGSEF